MLLFFLFAFAAAAETEFVVSPVYAMWCNATNQYLITAIISSTNPKHALKNPFAKSLKKTIFSLLGSHKSQVAKEQIFVYKNKLMIKQQDTENTRQRQPF